jgi:hypothetical protein
MPANVESIQDTGYGETMRAFGSKTKFQDVEAKAKKATVVAVTKGPGVVLPLDVAPREHTVVCSCIKKNDVPVGNRRLVSLARGYVQLYADAGADWKPEKTDGGLVARNSSDEIPASDPLQGCETAMSK